MLRTVIDCDHSRLSGLNWVLSESIPGRIGLHSSRS